MAPAQSILLATTKAKYKEAEAALQAQNKRLRAISAQLAEVSETERKLLARRLHDQVGQNLTALGINLNIIQSQLAPHTNPDLFSRLDDSLALVDQTTDCIRDVMADLRPPMLDDYGLGASLQWYGEQFDNRTGIGVTAVMQAGMSRFPTRIENTLFRITQEALTNVAKHAEATQVTVRLSAKNKTINLIVCDNGVGFEPAKLIQMNEGNGWGLLTIKERAESIGGRCQIKPNPGEGVQVTVEVPL